jgi:peptidoglycan/xylan/chitin deacetylase (PgdA/CDA1 family)
MTDARTCTIALTVNLQGDTVERREVASEEALFGRYSYGKYMAAVGATRLFDMLRARGLKATVFVPGAEAQAHRKLVERIAADGHEIAAHGWAMEDYLAEAGEQRPLLERTHALLQEITGQAPVGWRAPHGRLTRATLAQLAQLGYRYDASFQDDDFPYRLDADGGAGMTELPQSEMLNDALLYGLRQPHDRVMQAWREEFEGLYQERCFGTVTVHPRSDYGSGRASRVAALERFLDHIQALPQLSIVSCGQALAEVEAGRLFCRG